MKIATWNVNGIRARQAQFADWIIEHRPDVVCLQELKAKKEQIPETCGLPEYSCYWHGAGAYSGVGLHVRNEAFAGADVTFSHPVFDVETRIVQAEVGPYVFASVYVPNGGKDFPAKMEFMRALEGYVADVHAAGKQLVLCGDLNVARTERDVHPKERKPNAIGQLPEERELLERIIGHGLVDVGRALDPDNDELFTWWAPWRNMRQRNIGWRLDYVLASEPLARRARSCRVYREFGTSDHGPVIAELDVS
jgi:exodeoxyribonuclease III